MALSTYLQLSNVEPTQSTAHQQAAKLFQQHLRRLKGNDDLNSTFENADRLIDQKRTSNQFHNIASPTF
jgi:hypothetical protein